MLPQVAEKFFKQRIEDRQKAAAPAQKAEGINPEVVAAISAVVADMGSREGRQYAVGNISRLNNQNRWGLYGMLERFRTKL